MLKKRGYRTIGLVGPGSMPHAFVTRIKEGLPGTAFVDATDFVDRLKALKSPEEIGLIKRCCEMQDAIFAKVVSSIKPGMRDCTAQPITRSGAPRRSDSRRGSRHATCRAAR